MTSPELALELASRASCAAVGISFLEQLYAFRRIYGPNGIYSRSVTRLAGAPELLSRLDDSTLRLILVLGTASSLLGLLFGPFAPVGRVAVAITFLVAVANRAARVMGGDGAEQMALLCLFATCLAVVPGVSKTSTELATWFIGGQLILCYFTAGTVKAVSPVWRSGAALALVMGSEAYGQRWFARILDAFPRLTRALNWAVVILECLFPLILFAPPVVVVLLLAAGFVFHATSAVTMGLNTFALAFPATYLCVIVLVQEVSPYWP